jgi:hypothetical protein
MRLEVDYDGERIALFEEPQRRRRWSRRRGQTPAMWSPQEVNEHTVACYLAGKKLSVVLAMPEDEMTRRAFSGVRELNGGDYLPFEWWGFGGVGMESALALVDGPWVLCETWNSWPTEEETRREARVGWRQPKGGVTARGAAGPVVSLARSRALGPGEHLFGLGAPRPIASPNPGRAAQQDPSCGSRAPR